MNGALVKLITYCGNQVILACDGKCEKAWGRNSRPHVGDRYLRDAELGVAPVHPGTTEGSDGKPTDYTDPDRQNRWCARECERSILSAGGVLKLPYAEGDVG